jgi:hypothetical protein
MLAGFIERTSTALTGGSTGCDWGSAIRGGSFRKVWWRSRPLRRETSAPIFFRGYADRRWFFVRPLSRPVAAIDCSRVPEKLGAFSIPRPFGLSFLTSPACRPIPFLACHGGACCRTRSCGSCGMSRAPLTWSDWQSPSTCRGTRSRCATCCGNFRS